MSVFARFKNTKAQHHSGSGGGYSGGWHDAGPLTGPFPYDPTTDDVGAQATCPRDHGEACDHYRARLLLHLQNQIVVRQNYELLLQRLIAVSDR